jgi:hypothetical protein
MHTIWEGPFYLVHHLWTGELRGERSIVYVLRLLRLAQTWNAQYQFHAKSDKGAASSVEHKQRQIVFGESCSRQAAACASSCCSVAQHNNMCRLFEFLLDSAASVIYDLATSL